MMKIDEILKKTYGVPQAGTPYAGWQAAMGTIMSSVVKQVMITNGEKQHER